MTLVHFGNAYLSSFGCRISSRVRRPGRSSPAGPCDGDSLVVKADVPGIVPNKDVDITLAGDELRINVRHEETTEHKDKLAYRLKSGTAPSP